MRARRYAATLAATAVLAGGLVGCGEEETPVQQEPALADALAEVDAAAAADNTRRLRRAVADLVQVTDDAEQAGDLDGDDADRIRTAAEALLEAAGAEPEPAPSTTSTEPEPPETTTSSPPAPPEEDDEGDEDDDEKDEPGKGQKGPKGKGPKKDD